MRASRIVLTTIATASLTLALASCMGAAPEPAPEATAPEVETTAPVETTEAEAAPAAGDFTAPGTELAIGETAIVPLSYGTELESQPLSVTVTGVVEGNIADFEAAGLEQSFLDDLAGYQTYYITVEAAKAQGAVGEFAYASVTGDMGAFDSTGDSMSPVSIIGDFTPCNEESFDSSIDEGATVSSCFIVAAPDTTEFGSVSFAPSDGDYNRVDGQPILWS